jgi:hypothetical protein
MWRKCRRSAARGYWRVAVGLLLRSSRVLLIISAAILSLQSHPPSTYLHIHSSLLNPNPSMLNAVEVYPSHTKRAKRASKSRPTQKLFTVSQSVRCLRVSQVYESTAAIVEGKRRHCGSVGGRGWLPIWHSVIWRGVGRIHAVTCGWEQSAHGRRIGLAAAFVAR